MRMYLSQTSQDGGGGLSQAGEPQSPMDSPSFERLVRGSEGTLPGCECFLSPRRPMCPRCLRITQPVWRQRSREWSLVSGIPQVRLYPQMPHPTAIG